MKKVLFAACIMLLAASMAYAGHITGTKHDLSSTNTLYDSAGLSRSDQICIYCHTPHNAVTTTIPAPLWNHLSTAASYSTYSSANSATFDGGTTTVGAVSKACLSCHDGTVAVDTYYGHDVEYGGGPDMVNSGSTNYIQGITSPDGSTANLGTDLTNDHPIGFDYTADTDTGIAAASGGLVASTFPLYGSPATQMECPTCHAVHDNTYTPFLRMSNTGSTMCLACHTNK
jgi:predicted CXXCH cytochrome family protein